VAVTLPPEIAIELVQTGWAGQTPFQEFAENFVYTIALATVPSGAAGEITRFVGGAAEAVTGFGGRVLVMTSRALTFVAQNGRALADALNRLAVSVFVAAPTAYVVGRIAWNLATGDVPEKITNWATQKADELAAGAGGSPSGPSLSGLDLALILGVILAVALVLEG
jgi:hypothetical protein